MKKISHTTLCLWPKVRRMGKGVVINMKIITKKLDYEKVIALPKEKRVKPRKQAAWIRVFLKSISQIALKDNHFTCDRSGWDNIPKEQPCIVLVNHSSFIDLEIVADVMVKRPYHIVCTKDGFVGLGPILKLLGCIPTNKFINDVSLVKDMTTIIKQLKEDVVLFPEASYSFDGTSTVLPESLGKCVKLLKVPVVMIRTKGAFLQNPLYNELRRRKVNVSAKVVQLLSVEEVQSKSVDEINQVLAEAFDYDHFKEQQETGILVKESFRADGLHRVLYKCPHCLREDSMEGKGITITCRSCGASYELLETGFLKAKNCEEKFNHIPDWYRWQRHCVKKELEEHSYQMELDVDIAVLVNTKCVYKVGHGHLSHTKEGFHLTGLDGKLDYYQKPVASYSLYSDFYWYEIADMISIGDEKIQYYCFPKTGGNVVAKARIATEELYKLCKNK